VLANLGDSGIAAKRWDQRFVMPAFVDLNLLGNAGGGLSSTGKRFSNLTNVLEPVDLVPVPCGASTTSIIPRERAALTYRSPPRVAGGAVETYPAGLAVASLYKLSLPQDCLSSHGRSGVTVASKAQ
jgi:hypothetical protein